MLLLSVVHKLVNRSFSIRHGDIIFCPEQRVRIPERGQSGFSKYILPPNPFGWIFKILTISLVNLDVIDPIPKFTPKSQRGCNVTELQRTIIKFTCNSKCLEILPKVSIFKKYL